MKKDRIVYFDYLRVFAIISVIVLHIACENWGELSGRSTQWHILNFYDSISRWGVPVFLMISGALFLSKEIEVKKLYSKYILRMVIAYFVWALFYAVAGQVGEFLVDPSYEISCESIISGAITGAFHMWFIPMIIGIYMCIPIIKQIIGTKKLTEYFLLLSFGLHSLFLKL